MKNSGTHTQYTAVERNNQLVLILNSEIKLPKDAPVRVTSAQLEELDYRKLYAAYSSRGRKSVTDPRVIFKVMAYGYQCGIFSSRKLEEACQYRVDFMWLLENQKAPDHATFSRFRTGRCSEAVADLFNEKSFVVVEYKKLSTGRPGNMPRSALLCPKTEIWAVTGNLGLEIGMLRAKQQGCCKNEFCNSPGFLTYDGAQFLGLRT